MIRGNVMKTLWLAISVLAVGGCGVDLGECVPGDDQNLPYLGQQHVHNSCAAGRCHSALATGTARNGAPAGLDFDAPGTVATPADAQLQATGLANIREHASEIFAAIEDGTMPAGTAEAPAAAIDALQKEQIRNWLACGAPVVAPDDMVVTPGANGLEVAFPQMANCVGCHNPSLAQGGYLLGDDVCAAYNNLMAGASTSASCGGNSLVVAGDPGASLLLSKMTANPLCGVSMPQGGTPFAESNVDAYAALTEWVMAGAPKPVNCP